MRASQDNSSQRLEGSTQGQRAETLQAMKRGRINERPNLRLVINKEEPRMHQQDEAGVGRTCPRLRLGELRTTAGRAIVTVRERRPNGAGTAARGCWRSQVRVGIRLAPALIRRSHGYARQHISIDPP